MKKAYEAPVAEKIAFNYRDQVVAASGGSDSSGGGNEVVNTSQDTWDSNCNGLDWGDFFNFFFGMCRS